MWLELGVDSRQLREKSYFNCSVNLRRRSVHLQICPEAKSGRWGFGLTAAKMNECCWLKPSLVGQFEFSEWTPENHLRHSRFVELRDDKDPRKVSKEIRPGGLNGERITDTFTYSFPLNVTIGSKEDKANDGLLDSLVSRCPKPLGGIIRSSANRGGVIQNARSCIAPLLTCPPKFFG
jgi:hypothetical protein